MRQAMIPLLERLIELDKSSPQCALPYELGRYHAAGSLIVPTAIWNVMAVRMMTIRQA
jgi:hypothetical protein